MSREARISFASSAQASKARDSERTSVLSQSKRRVVICSCQLGEVWKVARQVVNLRSHVDCWINGSIDVFRGRKFWDFGVDGVDKVCLLN